MTTGQRIQQARKAANLSQRRFGELLGVSGSMIGQYENDLRNPKQGTLERMADVLGVNANWLRTGQTPDQLQDGARQASADKAYDEIYRLLGFLDLPPEKMQKFQNSCNALKYWVDEVNKLTSAETDPTTLSMMTQAFPTIMQGFRELQPDGISEIKRRYEDQKHRNQKYEELLTQYEKLTPSKRRKVMEYIDFMIYLQEQQK